jgi:hypothetical protein
LPQKNKRTSLISDFGLPIAELKSEISNLFLPSLKATEPFYCVDSVHRLCTPKL